MDLNLRKQLEELAERLHLHSGSAEVEAHRLKNDVESALDGNPHDGLEDRLEEGAVEFESEHPQLAEALRRAVDALSAIGI